MADPCYRFDRGAETLWRVGQPLAVRLRTKAAASDFPIPTQFNGLRLPSTDELDPQVPSHFTVCPSGVDRANGHGLVRGERVRVAQTRIAHSGDRFLSLFLQRLPAHDLLIHGPSGIARSAEEPGGGNSVFGGRTSLPCSR